MGGCIGITIREENGKEHRMCRWTNPTPHFINHSKFIEKDKSHLENYLKTWYEMVDDYNGPKKLNMSDVYAPSPYLAPMEYGLIVVDYKTNKVLHSQGYTSLGSLLPSSLSLCAMSGRDDDYAKEELEDAKKLFDTGKIISARGYSKETGIVEIEEPTFDEVIKNQKRSFNFLKETKTLMTDLFLDMSPWEIKKFDESAEGVVELKKEVINLGFKITKEEEKEWKCFLERFEEE